MKAWKVTHRDPYNTAKTIEVCVVAERADLALETLAKHTSDCRGAPCDVVSVEFMCWTVVGPDAKVMR